MAITSPEEFFAALAKSRLLDSEQLVHAQDTLLLTSSAEHVASILVEEGLLTEWQASQLLAGGTVFHIGNYVLLDLLGRGGMGSVFLARHTTMNRQVALKTISRRVGKNPASLARFLSEARATASLDHPNIVRAFDVDQERERFYIVMEYVAGHDLAELVALEGPLDFAFVADCIRQAAEGLSHAHKRNMVHCDIKPSNLLITDRGVVKILDMGMARLLNQTENDSSVNRDERVLGTVDYMAPEQAMDGPNFDHRADIYSLGCTMYHLLAGHPPFDEGTLAQRIVQHQTKPPPDLLAEHPDTPPELAAICMKMLAKDPADRYQTADEVAQALAAWRPRARPAGEAARPAENAKPTGVAIDEEDFRAVRPPRPGSKAHVAAESQRRFVFWTSAAAIALGGLLVVLAIVLLATYGGPDYSNPIEMPTEPEPVTAQRPQESPSAPQPSPKTSEPAETSSAPPGPAASSVSPGLPLTEPKPAAKRIDRPPQTRTTPKEPTPTAVQSGSASTSPAGSGQSTLPLGAASADSSLFPVEPGGAVGTPSASAARPGGAGKVQNPFDALPAMLELPLASQGSDGVAIGKVRSGSKEPLSLALLGASAAAGPQLAMEPRAGKSEWVIRRIGPASDQVDVARVWLRRGELMFAWLESSASADALQGRLLELRSGEFARAVQLGKPRVETPLVVEFDKGTAQRRLPLGEQFQGANLEIVITGIEGVGNVAVVKNPVVLTPEQPQDVLVLQGGGCKVVVRTRYQVRASAGHLEATVFCQLPGRGQLTRFSARNMKAVYRIGAILDDREKKLSERLANAGKMSDAEKKSLKQVRRKVQSELKCLTNVRDWVQASGGALRVHFQERVAIGEHRVVLSDTRPSGAEAPPDTPMPQTVPSQVVQPGL